MTRERGVPGIRDLDRDSVRRSLLYRVIEEDFQKGGAVDKVNPTTWSQDGSEIDFGDGTFGKYFKGTITANRKEP